MPYEHQQRDLEWAEAIRSGDSAAFERLFRAYAGPLCVFVGRTVRDPDIAEEIIQDVFFDIWRRQAEWQPRTNVRAYLYKSARNRALDYLDHRRVVEHWQGQDGSGEEDESGRADAGLLQQELEEAVAHAVEQLPERRKEIFLLTRRHDMTYAEVAETLGISVNTVETQMTRAFRALRKSLAHLSPYLSAFL